MIGDTSLTALLAGTELPPGSPPELRPLAEALAELRAQPAVDELKGEAKTLAAFRNQFGVPRRAHHPPARTPAPRRRHLPVKAAAAAAAVLSLGGIATAAYAGALPATVQRLAHDVIGGVPAPATRSSIGPSPAGPAPTGAPGYGLCTAWAHAKAHGTAKRRAVAFGKLAAAAGGAANVTTYCATAAPPRTSPSQTAQPSSAPHGSGRPSAPPTPHSTGKPSGLPSPHATGAPTVRPTPDSTGKPSGLPTPRSSSGH
jgi:hypothetical protein